MVVVLGGFLIDECVIRLDWKRGRVVEGARLEIVWAERSRRFESSRFRHGQPCWGWIVFDFYKKEKSMSSVFKKIIDGEIPCYKVYEDDKTLAFLDINPETEGHVLVVPKVEVDKIYDLKDADWTDLWATVKKVALWMEDVLGARILMKVIGTDVPHAHVHLMPFDDTWQYGRHLELSADEFEKIAKKLRF